MSAFVDAIQLRSLDRAAPQLPRGPPASLARRHIYTTAVSTRRPASSSPPSFSQSLAPHSHSMASKKAAAALCPAINRLAPPVARFQCLQSARYSTTSRAALAPRPRNFTRPSPQQTRFASSKASEENLGKTGLYELHSRHGAKFVPFGGYLMPVQYSDLSIIESHNWTREKASLFDVGHM